MKVLVVYAGFGHGHKIAAQAFTRVSDRAPQDLLDFTHPLMSRFYSRAYIVITQHFPWLWWIMFSSTKIDCLSGGIDFLHRLIFSPFFRYLKKMRPQVVIATHFFPAELAAAIKDELNIKIISVVTDLRVHPLWATRKVDHYFAALDVTRNDLVRLGIAPEKITAGYTPLREGFIRDIPREELCRKFSLEERPNIIFVSSSRGYLPLLRQSIKTIAEKFNIFVIYGKNTPLKAFLASLDSAHIHYFPYYDHIWELITLSSVIITKPGGLTIFEGIYKRKPFIFTHYIPGHERDNMEFLIDHGVAKFVQSKKGLIDAIDHFVDKSAELSRRYPLRPKDISLPLKGLLWKFENEPDR